MAMLTESADQLTRPTLYTHLQHLTLVNAADWVDRVLVSTGKGHITNEKCPLFIHRPNIFRYQKASSIQYG